MNGSLLNGHDLFNSVQGVMPHWNTVLKYWAYNCAVVMKKLVTLYTCSFKLFKKYNLCVAFLTILSMCNDQDSVDSIQTPCNLNEKTLSTIPARVESIDKSDRAKGPRIISLVLAVFTCMSLSSAQCNRFSMKASMYESWVLDSTTSDEVVASTYLCLKHLVVRSLMSVRNERGPS